jgi:hypothetical protein
MKFEKFQSLREKMIQEGTLNESVKSFQEYKELFVEASNELESEEILSTIEESDIDILGIAAFEDTQLDEADSKSNIFKNIFGWMKLKGLSSKYMKSMVDEGIVEMDYARRKAASDSKEETEQLKQAHTAKKDALTDRTKAIAEKIDSIATTDFLKKVAQKTKIGARIKKNEVILKIASKEEAKELRLRNAELNQDLQSVDGELREYEKENKEAIKDAKKEAAEKIKGEIGQLEEKIKDVQKQIIDKEDSLSNVGESATYEAEGDDAPKKQTAEEKGKIYAELATLKADKAKLLDQQLEKKKAYNEATESDEYDLESGQEEIEGLVQDAKDYEQKANDAGTEVSDTPTEDKPTDDTPAEDKPSDNTPAEDKPSEEEPAEDVEVDKEAVEKQQKTVDNLKAEIQQLETDIKDAEAEKTKKNKQAADILKGAMDGKKKSLVKAEEKLAELKKGKKKETAQESRSTMTFEEFRISRK